MNILHISTPLSWRGGEQQLAYLANELQDQNQEQYFVCAAQGEVEAFCLENDFAFFPVNTGFLSLSSNGALIKRICKNFEIDIIHTHDSKGHTMAYCAAIQGCKTPLVVSRRVDFPVGKSWLSRKKYNHPGVKAIICVSEAIKEITGQSIHNKNVLKVIYDGIETKLENTESKPDLKALFNLPEDSIIIGNVAALAPHKDYFTWLDTAALLYQQNSNYRFLMVGDGPQKAEILSYLQNKGLKDIAIPTGFRDDAKELIRGFDLFLNTSETEGLGSSLLDAFVRRIPVVATEAGGIPEIVKNEITGLLAPIKNPSQIAAQVTQMLNDNALREKILENAWQFSLGFDKKTMTEKTLEVYKSVL